MLCSEDRQMIGFRHAVMSSKRAIWLIEESEMTKIVSAILFAVAVTVAEGAPARAGAPFGSANQMDAGQPLSTVLKEITPAVVSIEAKRLVGQAITGSPTARRQGGLFSATGTAATKRDQYASGSGVVIDAGAGLIVTRACSDHLEPLSSVIAGLDPAIHPYAKRMDPRVKPAGDGEEEDQLHRNML